MSDTFETIIIIIILVVVVSIAVPDPPDNINGYEVLHDGITYSVAKRPKISGSTCTIIVDDKKIILSGTFKVSEK